MAGHIFISHSSKDEAITREIADALSETDLPVWVDFEDIKSGDQWPKHLETHIESCVAVVLVWSKSARRSEWVERETIYAFEHKKPVHIVRIDEELLGLHIVNRQALDLTTDFKQNIKKLAAALRRELKKDKPTAKKSLPIEPTEANFFPYLEQLPGGKQNADIAHDILKWAKIHIDSLVYGGKITPCLNFRVELGAGTITAFTLWAYPKNPAVQVRFMDLMKHPFYRKEDLRLSTLKSLNRIMGDDSFLPDQADRAPTIPLEKLGDDENMRLFKRIMAEIVESLRSV